MKTVSLMTIAFGFILLTGCEKTSLEQDNNNNNNNTLLSPAAIIAGTYKGDGKVMPDNIQLGTYSGCVTPPGWESKFIEGTSYVIISTINDSTVKIILSGGPFSNNTFSNIKVVKSTDAVTFGFGFFDINSKFLNLSRNNTESAIITTNACLQGLPYYTGWSALIDGNYLFITRGHIDFSGTKQ